MDLPGFVTHVKLTSHVGYVQRSCSMGGTEQFATFFNISVAKHVTACDVRVTHQKNRRIIHYS